MSRPSTGPRSAPRWASDSRRLAFLALTRIEDGAYANLVLPPLLDRSRLDTRDRGFATELVYGTTRMQRSCDWLVDQFLLREVERDVRVALRLGAYQVHYLRVPAHAAVSATVDVAPPKARGLVNAVLRRVADQAAAAVGGDTGQGVRWPDVATELSYPDHVVAQLDRDLGSDLAHAALETMNDAPDVTERADGYVQDRASQWVAALVDAKPGERVADLCAAPGGKATALASTGAWTVASDVTRTRVGLIVDNASRLGLGDSLAVAAADALAPPYRAQTFHRVLVDAPCSGLGVLRRRPDARWRIDPDAVARLARLQRHLVDATVELVRPGGLFVYSVCTLSADETLGIDRNLARGHSELRPIDPPGEPWVPHGRGALLLPQAAGTDGMFILRLARPDP